MREELGEWGPLVLWFLALFIVAVSLGVGMIVTAIILAESAP